MRDKLAPYLYQEVQCRARIVRFDQGKHDQPIALMADLSVNGERVSDHIWLRKKTGKMLFTNFQPGQYVTFRAKVHRYQKLNSSPEGVWKYGLKNAKSFCLVEGEEGV